MHQYEALAALMRELLASYPPILQIPMVAQILKEEVPTIRARVRRGAFPVTVRQEAGGRQYVLMVDLVRFICTGETQPQPATRPIRIPRNPLGLNGKGKRGAPTKAERIAREIAERA